MKLLSKLTPAETLMIKEAGSIKFRDLMKYTFMDLLLKKVIKMVNIGVHTYVIAGENFLKYKPKNHERVYLNPYRKNASLQVLFQHFIAMAYEESKGGLSYKKHVRTNAAVNEYFKQTFFTKLFLQNKLTDDGLKLKKEISSYLNDVDSKIEKLIITDEKKGVEILLTLGGNIFLLKSLDFKLLKNIDKEILKQQRKFYSDSYDSDNTWWLYFDFFEDGYMFESYFDNFHDIMNDFDNQFDDAGSSSDDSGCSSCGGCGD